MSEEWLMSCFVNFYIWVKFLVTDENVDRLLNSNQNSNGKISIKNKKF